MDGVWDSYFCKCYKTQLSFKEKTVAKTKTKFSKTIPQYSAFDPRGEVFEDVTTTQTELDENACAACRGYGHVWVRLDNTREREKCLICTGTGRRERSWL